MGASDLKRQAIDLLDAFTHGHGDPRRYMRDLVALVESVAAAETLVATIAPSAAAAAVIDPIDERLVTRRGGYAIDGAANRMTGYFAVPETPDRKLSVVTIIHENREPDAHIEDVERRVALAGSSWWYPIPCPRRAARRLTRTPRAT